MVVINSYPRGAVVLALLLFGLIFILTHRSGASTKNIPFTKNGGGTIEIPAPDRRGKDSGETRTTVEAALQGRRSKRSYADKPLELEELGQLFWAAQGVTDERGYRTAPSAGGLYPLEIFAVVGEVKGLAPGVYRYRPEKAGLELLKKGNFLAELRAAALGQEWVGAAPVNIVFGGVYQRLRQKYGERARRYTLIEVGAAAQNVYLQAESLGLGTVSVGAFNPGRVSKKLALPEAVEPLLLMPVGRVK